MTYPRIQEAGQGVLLVGSDDFEIRVFKNEEIAAEITEADRVTFLNSLGGSKASHPFPLHSISIQLSRFFLNKNIAFLCHDTVLLWTE